MKNVFYKTTVVANDIQTLENCARVSDWKRARICLHEKDAVGLQQMIISLAFDSYLPPHRQRHCMKSYFILKGGLRVFFFPSPETCEEFILHADKNTSAIISMFDAGIWHTVQALTSVCTFLETRNGDGAQDTEFASWAPTRDQSQAGNVFLKNFQNNG